MHPAGNLAARSPDGNAVAKSLFVRMSRSNYMLHMLLGNVVFCQPATARSDTTPGMGGVCGLSDTRLQVVRMRIESSNLAVPLVLTRSREDVEPAQVVNLVAIAAGGPVHARLCHAGFSTVVTLHVLYLKALLESAAAVNEGRELALSSEGATCLQGAASGAVVYPRHGSFRRNDRRIPRQHMQSHCKVGFPDVLAMRCSSVYVF